MSIFNRKPKNDFEEQNTIINNEAPIDQTGELSEKERKLIEENEISDGAMTDEVPSANATGREGGSKKKLQLAVIAMVGLLIVLLGLGTAVARYQESKEEKRISEAEQLAADQKGMAGGTLNIEDDQNEIAMNTFNDIPPPADALEDPLTAPFGNDAMAATPPPSYQPTPYIEPPNPSPRYDTEAPSTSYSLPASIPESSSGGSFFGGGNSFNDDAPAAPPMKYEPPMAKGADSNVLVDVNSLRAASAQATSGQGGGKSQVGGNLNPTVLQNASANRRNGKSLTMLRGTTIPCVLKTRIDSTYQGFTVCQTSKDVYSADGKSLLLERGSQVFGEQNISLNQGQARVAILWTRVETPQGVSVDIDSPATGNLGEMGVGANVKNHFWKRFGGAIMLSIIQDAIQAGSTRLEDNKDNSGDNNTSIQNTQRATESMAEKALENTINIPPTATIKQGTIINIMVVRDVDFSSVYKLRRK